MSVGVVNKQTGDRIPTAGMPAIDSVLSGSSTNPVQNRVVKAALDEKADTDLVASDFDATASYTAGNYCIYEGKFYKFKNNHSGAWAAADVDEIQIAGELSSIKSGLTTLDNEVNGDATVYPYADVITIPDAIPVNLADCTVKIEPDQNLHGFDHPWVGGAGDNKVPNTKYNGVIGSNGSYSSADNRVCNDNTGYTSTMKLSAGTYTINVEGLDQCTVLIKDSNNQIVDNYADSWKTMPFTFVVTDGGLLYYSARKSNNDNISPDDYNTMLVIGETSKSYTPYTNICPITGHTEASVTVVDDAENPTVTKTYTIALGDTIYGGTVRIDSNGNTVMDVDRAVVKGSDITWVDNTVSDHQRFRSVNVIEGAKTTEQSTVDELLCTIFGTNRNPITNSDVNGISMFGGYVYIRSNTTTTLQDFENLIADAYICYTVATPTTIQLTPQQIQLLKGQNTLTASTGQISVTVNGVSGAIGSLQTQANTTDEALAELVADIADKLPTAPTTDGAYVLTVTVADGTPTYSWESAT